MHFPFCARKCSYCDFYSAAFSAQEQTAYVQALCEQITAWGARLSLPADTLYLGGGTPTLLPGDLLAQTIDTTARQFGPFEEISVEANPADRLAETFARLRQAGVNRVSLGVQSALPGELARLGRRHTPEQVTQCASDLRAAGIQNLSLDIMLGIPGQTGESLRRTMEFCLALRPQHVSAYMLKIEPGTPFGRIPPQNLPDADQTAALYLQLCDDLRAAGFLHYEISNFCRPGLESRHNLKYWTQAPYLGLGPGAHSLIGGKRFYFPRDLQAFLKNPQPVPDGDGGSASEYVMLRLRLAAGLDYAQFRQRYGRDFLTEHRALIERLQSDGLAEPDPERLCLTERGFLVSNAILAQLL